MSFLPSSLISFLFLFFVVVVFVCLFALFFFFFFFCFLGLHSRHMEVTRLGPNRSYSCWPTPQPQQHQIWATSSTYTTAHSIAGSLTYWVRPGIEPVRPEIEPATSWFLVRFVSAAPQWELFVSYFYTFSG